MIRLAAAAALLAALGCSRSNDEPRPSTPALPTSPSASPSSDIARTDGGAVTAPNAPDDVPVPEDFEEAAERQITEQNLEQELDRLEREIAAD